jgi:hypothetical protein
MSQNLFEAYKGIGSARARTEFVANTAKTYFASITAKPAEFKVPNIHVWCSLICSLCMYVYVYVGVGVCNVRVYREYNQN